MDGLIFIFPCSFSVLALIEGPGPRDRVHTTSSDTHACIGEIQSSRLSGVLASCGVHCVWHVCGDETAAAAAVQVTAEFRTLPSD